MSAEPPAPEQPPAAPPAEAPDTSPAPGTSPAMGEKGTSPAVGEKGASPAVGEKGAPPAEGENPFGTPGPPLNKRNPFLLGFLFGLGVIVAYALFLGVRNAASILVLIFIALFLAIGLNPAVTRLRQWGLPRGPAVAIVALSVVLLLAGGLVALIPPLVTQTTELINNAPEVLESLRRSRTVNNLVQRYDLANRVQGAVNAGTITNALGGVVGGARLLFGTIFNILTVLVLTIYFMAAFERMKATGYRLVPASRRERVQLLTDEILTKVGAYMVGALAIAVLAGASTFVLALILGLAYPFALAVVVAVCDLIPQIGATIGAVVISLVGLASSITEGVVCIVFFIVYQQLENYLIYPRVMRRSVRVSDVAALVAALLGVGLFGVIGALVAIPMVAGIQLIMREVVVPVQDAR